MDGYESSRKGMARKQWDILECILEFVWGNLCVGLYLRANVDEGVRGE